MTASASRTAVLGVVAAFAAIVACNKPRSSTGAGTIIESSGAPAVEINLELANHTFVVGEDVSMTVVVTNRTSADVEIPDPFHRDNWQPKYTLTGPSSPEGQTFSFRSVALKDTQPEPEGVPPVLLKLRPGESRRQDIPLRSWASLNEPGDYTIAAALDWKGLSARSSAVHFRLEKAQVTAASVGVDDEVVGTPGEWVEWFHTEGAGRRLYASLFRRPHTDVRSYEAFSVDPIFTAGAQATDLLSPWTNYNRQAELAKWRAWREGATLVGFVMGFKEAQRLELGAPPERVIRPALMTADGVLDIFVVTAGQPELALARFPAPNFSGAATPATVVWKTPIPLRPVAARVALAPQSAGSERRVLVVAQEAAGVVVYFMNARNGASPGRWEAVRIPDVTAVRDVQPALRVSPDGVAHAAIVVGQTSAPRQLSIADLTFDREGKVMGAAAVTPIGQVEAAPRTAAAGYVIAPSSPMRRDWIVLLENGKVVHSASNGEVRELANAPALPLQLISLESGTYILTVDANGKPQFTLLD